MPLRARSDLWANLPGVVAAYQPVMCPGGSLLARYNMAHGGDNRFMATSGTPPTWSPVTGWGFTAASNQYLATNIVPALDRTWSVIVRFSNVPSGAFALLGSYYTAKGVFAIRDIQTSDLMRSQYGNDGAGNVVDVAPYLSTGIYARCGDISYRNGLYDGIAASPANASDLYSIWIGARNVNTGAPNLPLTGVIQNVAIYCRILSAAEVWTASRQMAYCNVNPDWSVWSRRRQWYYAPQGGFLAAWARNSNSVIKQAGQ